MLRTMLLLALARPATIEVRVDALALPHAQTEQLHGELMTRLVEAGHAVGGPAAVTVRLTGGGDVVHVEIVHGMSVRARDVRGRGAVLRLAVIHAAIELLADVEAVRVDPDPALAAAPDRAVVVQLDDAAQLHAAPAIAAVVEAGWVVTPAAADATRRVCIGDHDGVATLAVVAVDAACEAGAPVTTWVADLAAALRVDPHEPEPPPLATLAPAPIAPARVDTPIPPRKPPPRSWSGVLGVGLGVQGRLRHVEPLAIVHGDARHRSGAWITARLASAPSTEVAVVDTFITAGAGYGRTLARRLRLEVALAGGVVVHGYRIAGDRGARVDPTLELPIAAALALGHRVELVLAATAGVSTRARSHVREREVWSRDRWRVAGTLGINVLLGRKPTRVSSAGGT
jgi:hypothetical protein